MCLKKNLAAQRLAKILLDRVATLKQLGLGYLAGAKHAHAVARRELQPPAAGDAIGIASFMLFMLDEPYQGFALRPIASRTVHGAATAGSP
jgi:excinuclease ABC subunit A